MDPNAVRELRRVRRDARLLVGIYDDHIVAAPRWAHNVELIGDAQGVYSFTQAFFSGTEIPNAWKANTADDEQLEQIAECLLAVHLPGIRDREEADRERRRSRKAVRV